MLIEDLFERDVTRDIPPVVYFWEQSPERLSTEVEEYIITGGYDPKDPRGTRVEHGIHEQYVRMLGGICTELDKKGGPSLPASWISGFYGSGKSSFAKLLGLSLNETRLPNGGLLAEALLKQDRSPRAEEFHVAWSNLLSRVKPMAVVFDIGGEARGDEHIHSVVVRQCQIRMGYCSTSNLVADFELKLEVDGEWEKFLDTAHQVLKKPWTDLKDRQLAEDHFSHVMHVMAPERYKDPMSWIESHAGVTPAKSPADAVTAIANMLHRRFENRTLFIVVDEVSQYVHDDVERMERLRTLVENLGSRLKGKAWLFATGQQQLEDNADRAGVLSKLKDRFPPQLRVHLGSANIRDVVHKRLLQKKRLVEEDLRSLFQETRHDLALNAYRGDNIVEDDFVEIYPMLPGHIDLLMDITTGLRMRSKLMQGDSHAIRGLLQLLGDLFREKRFASREVGDLLTLDLVYDILHTALSSDVQATLVRALEFAKTHSPLAVRVVKAVALLELIQDHQKTDCDLVSRCLYERLGQGSSRDAVGAALESLQAENFLSYSEGKGFKIQSSAGQEWQKERDSYSVGPEQISAKVQESLTALMAEVEGPKLDNLALRWRAFYSDSVGQPDVRLKDERSNTLVTVDFQYVQRDERKASDWVARSDTGPQRESIIWLPSELLSVSEEARTLVRSQRMVDQYSKQVSSLPDDRQYLLIEERNRLDNCEKRLKAAVAATFLSGTLFFRGRQVVAKEHGATFAVALHAFGQKILKDLYPNPVTYSVTEKDFVYLIENVTLTAPPPVFGPDQLGILALDGGRYELACNGAVPKALLAFIAAQPGVTGSTLLQHFGGPGYGYVADVVRASLLGLLRAHMVRVVVEGVGELTSVKDAGARNLIQDRALRHAEFSPNVKDPLEPRDRVAICAVFKEQLGAEVQRDDDAIAEAVAQHFAVARERLTQLQQRFARLPVSIQNQYPETLTKLEKALEDCRRHRQVETTVKAVKRSLNALRDGFSLLRRMETDLSDSTIQALSNAAAVQEIYLPQLHGQIDKALYSIPGDALEKHLAEPRPWTDVNDLSPHVEALKTLYRERRQATLNAQGVAVEAAVASMKRREGFDTLNPDQQHQVLTHLRQGAPLNTTAEVVAPALAQLDAEFRSRLESAEQKAFAQLDELLEDGGALPTVPVQLDVKGREIASERDLERFLKEIEALIRKELAAKRRVRLR